MTATIMAKEAAESPHVLAEQFAANADICQKLGETLRMMSPTLVFLIGRGSSDHAGVFAKYLFEVEMGLPVSSAAPSVSSVFNRTLTLKNSVALVISQSGRSPDILKQAEAARAGGAFTIALVNDEHSPLAELADAVLPLRAGTEKAVAATKSYMATLSALVHLCACWNQNKALLQGLQVLPDALEQVKNMPPQLPPSVFQGVRNTVVLGRGFGFAVACEMALKLKEVLGIHAEAFSSAEFIHGPVTLVEKQLQIVNVTVNDETYPFHTDILKDVSQRGAAIQTLAMSHSLDETVHTRLRPLLLILRFYLDIERIAVAFGLNPDMPPGLNKVTKTQ
ncbi:SIS domain-containing protein [Aestuariibacter sp. AA17]|uniref:SIS domain-containing protein n=1 Tax=Fluctibacter corallii TaxID=2984329 RepID=A0ABT3A4Z9_9ALTE|nr:SIS domain-containing protein [Aestuariibacter sp. AA17]MCV2883755.1 SIS domain-containing protein [Aestuariibacter sp. AA17]